jgi:hypothetical protein
VTGLLRHEVKIVLHWFWHKADSERMPGYPEAILRAVPEKSDFRYVWSAALSQAKSENSR